MAAKNPGYYRYPAICDDTIVYICDDDLWSVSLQGGLPRRLTNGFGLSSHPVFSPDGSMIAFAGEEEGSREVYVIPSEGGIPKRLTFLGQTLLVVDWTKEGIYFSSSYKQPLRGWFGLFRLDLKTGVIDEMNIGPVLDLSFGPQNGSCVIQRHGHADFGKWKRYRGGTVGDLWIDRKGDGQFERLLSLDGNLSHPLWIKDRIYFCADHEGHGNIYSCDLKGKNLNRHSDYEGFYVRSIDTDGKNIVYQQGADLFVMDIATDKHRKLSIENTSAMQQKKRKFVSAAKYISEVDIHPNGHHLTAVARGSAFCFSNWEGAVHPFGRNVDARYHMAKWLNDGKRIIAVSDEPGEDHLEIYDAASFRKLKKITEATIGIVQELVPSPKADEVILSNHRGELILINLKDWKQKVLDKAPFGHITGLTWSADGKWIAYSCPVAADHSSVPNLDSHRRQIKIATQKGKVYPVTNPVLEDYHPSFDPDGKYLYFLSRREFNPQYDSLHFNLCFARGSKPYLITLQTDTPSPFELSAQDLAVEQKEQKESKKEKKKKEEEVVLKIDFEGIENRILAFPVDDGLYDQVIGIHGKVLFSSWCPNDIHQGGGDSFAHLEMYDFETCQTETITDEVSAFSVSMDFEHLLYQKGKSWRVIKAGHKPESPEDGAYYTKKAGWIEVTRLKVMVDPAREWPQILHEAWRMQRDFFWHKDLGKIDWEKVYQDYAPLCKRIATRNELTDLLWQMQGELGSSHAYAYAGDVRTPPHYHQGSLGADFTFDEKKKAYKIHNIVIGDPWDSSASSPLIGVGLNVKGGDFLHEIGGQKLTSAITPESLLVNYAGQPVRLTLSDKSGKNKRSITVKTLFDDTHARYRDWVNGRKEYVHTKTKGRIGYIHIPDMGPAGFAEFHRHFLAECARDGMIIDVRNNGGGHVSPLLIEKLARKRIGFDQSRWNGVIPYPDHSPGGPLVAVTNEYAGSDGDMFSHAFKLNGLGPLVGKRTWGGVIGINATENLADRGVTTQPEYAFWFNDVGWNVENRGADPDIEVEMTPQDHKAGRDPQLDRAIVEALKLLKTQPPLVGPDLKTRPDLRAPRLKKWGG
jgi:tricorn protease